MKKFSLLIIALLALASAHPAFAQIPPPPTPSPDPHTYTDPGMTFTAPPEAALVARQEPSLAQLSQDLQPVAVWLINPGKEDVRTIALSMEAYDGPPNQWINQFESQTHTALDGALIHSSTPMSLSNGMPANFVEIAFGSGFDSRKEFAVVWADGQRGIALAETTRLGDANADEAKRVLKQVTAVRYPLYQP
jgi:hypothetical protein